MERPPLEDFVRRVHGLEGRAELDAAAAEALDAFRALGVRCLLLKGPALSRLLYTPGEYRGYSDVDLLVAPDDLPGARRALSDLGYTNMTAVMGVEDVAGAVHADVWARRNETIGPLLIDLHTRLAGAQAAPEVVWRALEARRTNIELAGRPASVLDRVGLALHLAIHAAQHGQAKSKPIADLERGLESWPPEVWREASRLAQDVQASEAFAFGLRLVPAGAELAQELNLPAADHLEWEMLHSDVRPRGTFHLQALMDAPSLLDAARALRRALLPSRAWIVWQDPRAERSRAWLLAARARHLLRTPVWAMRALRYWRKRRRATG